jgi:uncharacterized protein
MFRPRFAMAMVAASLVCAVGAPLALSVPATAQQPPSAEHIKAARELVVSSGISASFEGIYTEFKDRVRQSVGTTRPEIAKDLTEVLDGLKGEADKRRDEMIDASAAIFARRMSQADLTAISAFFNSEVGKRYNATRPLAINDIFTELQPWSIRTSDALFKIMSDEMRKRGHNL